MLKEKLDEYAAQSAAKIPDAAKKTMKDSTRAVADSMSDRNIPQVGDQLPPFTLPNSEGDPRSLSELTASGPLIITFFRGMW